MCHVCIGNFLSLFCVCLSVCACMHVCVGTCSMGLMWRSEDNFTCQSVPSTLFEVESLCCPSWVVCQAGWPVSSFLHIPSCCRNSGITDACSHTRLLHAWIPNFFSGLHFIRWAICLVMEYILHNVTELLYFDFRVYTYMYICKILGLDYDYYDCIRTIIIKAEDVKTSQSIWQQKQIQ